MRFELSLQDMTKAEVQRVAEVVENVAHPSWSLSAGPGGRY